MQNKWYNIPQQTKINAYIQISEETGMASFAVEKDWWVVQTLALVFETAIARHLVFKGGTSLSKAWKLIDRFSEDIDLAVDRSFFGFNGVLNKKERTNLRKETSRYISEIFYPELEAKFKDKGLNEVNLKIIEPESSDQDPRIIEIYFPNVIESPGYIQPKIQLEIGCRSLREPFVVNSFSSLIDEYYPDSEFAQAPIEIPTVIPERTFLEKIFLLHEEFQRPQEKIRVDRLSRHLYDVYQLSGTDFAFNAINDKALYETIVEHRYTYTRFGGVNYNLHQPQTINPIPGPDLIDAWEADYKIMQQQMIYGDSPDFAVMIEALRNFVAQINQLEWKMTTKFPISKS